MNHAGALPSLTRQSKGTKGI